MTRRRARAASRNAQGARSRPLGTASRQLRERADAGERKPVLAIVTTEVAPAPGCARKLRSRAESAQLLRNGELCPTPGRTPPVMTYPAPTTSPTPPPSGTPRWVRLPAALAKPTTPRPAKNDRRRERR